MYPVEFVRVLPTALCAKFKITHCANAGEIDLGKIAAPSGGECVVVASLSASIIGFAVVAASPIMVGVTHVH